MSLLTSIQKLFAREAMPDPWSDVTTRAANDAGNVTQLDMDNGIDVGLNSDASTRRPVGRTGRIRTRMLSDGPLDDAFDATTLASARSVQSVRRPVGWLVVIEGPGAGDWFALESGLTQIGRGPDQDICLDFGDLTISRSRHAFVTYDTAKRRFDLGHGDSANSTRKNGISVVRSTELTHGDCISLGKTTLRLAAFCDANFQWPPIIDKGGSQ